MKEALTANNHPYCVGVGASGPEGLADIIELLNAWPERAHAVLMVVLHRSSEERSSLREVLLTRCPRMRVEIARQGQVLVPGCCYIGRPDWPLTLLGDRSAFLVDGTKDRLRNRPSMRFSRRWLGTSEREQQASFYRDLSMMAPVASQRYMRLVV